jgi:hypothetical protein
MAPQETAEPVSPSSPLLSASDIGPPQQRMGAGAQETTLPPVTVEVPVGRKRSAAQSKPAEEPLVVQRQPTKPEPAATKEPTTPVATKTDDPVIDTLAAVSVVRHDQINQTQGSRLSDVLGSMPGVWFSESGDDPASATFADFRISAASPFWSTARRRISSGPVILRRHVLSRPGISGRRRRSAGAGRQHLWVRGDRRRCLVSRRPDCYREFEGFGVRQIPWQLRDRPAMPNMTIPRICPKQPSGRFVRRPRPLLGSWEAEGLKVGAKSRGVVAILCATPSKHFSG